VLVADVDELLLQLVLDLLEGFDGLLLGFVRGTQLNGLGGGLGFRSQHDISRVSVAQVDVAYHDRIGVGVLGACVY